MKSETIWIIPLSWPTLWVCELCLNTFWTLSFSWKKLDEILTPLYPFTHNLHEVWFVWIPNLGQKPKLGVWWKEKVSQIVQRSPPWSMVLRKMESLNTKKMKRRKKKLSNKVVTVAKEMGCSVVHEKWIMGWILRMNENAEEKEGNLFIPHFLRISATEPKWPYIYTQSHYKPWKDLFDLEWAETIVDWKILANLWVKACIVFFFVRVRVAFDFGTLNH